MKIAFINQRYGKEVNGGSEYYTMLMAQKLKAHYEVEILTSKALTYDKWEDYYQEDVENIDGITVRRFGIKKKRNRYFQRLLKEFIVRLGFNTEKITGLWNKALGPYVPELVAYIEQHEGEYDAFIFVTYMYYPTVFGMEKVADKAIFVPTAHDEYNIYFKIYEKIFHLPRKIVYLTEEEKTFVQGHFHNEEVESHVIGVGVDIPAEVNEDRFRKKYGITGEYLIYAGRVDVDKGCKEMFDYFLRYLEEQNVTGTGNGDSQKLQLVVMGKSYMNIPTNKNVHYLGFVSDEDKYDGISGAKLLWLPSRFESLSIAVLEAMALGTPVIVNGRCDVLKGHCERSHAGVYYGEYEEFTAALEKTRGKEYPALCEQAGPYVAESYRWEQVIESWKKLIK